VTNIGCDSDVFVDSLIQRFRDEYAIAEEPTLITEDDLPEEAIACANQLQTWDWRYGQTPLFAHEFADADSDAKIKVHVDRGIITDVEGTISLRQLVGKRYLAEELESLVPRFVVNAIA
jgi:lipoate-protein ligase A